MPKPLDKIHDAGIFFLVARKMNMALTELINSVRVCQEKEGLSDGRFAAKLGIDQSLWSFIKRGKREPGAKVLKAFALEL